MFLGRRLEPAALLAVFGPRVVHRAQSAAQFLVQVGRDSRSWIDRFKQFEMLAEAFASGAELLHFFLRVGGFAFEHDERARQLVGHLGAAAVEFLLAAAQLLEFALLFLDLFLLALELEELFLRLLHLGIDRSVLIPSSSLSSSICSIGRMRSGITFCAADASPGILNGRLRNARFFTAKLNLSQ